MTNDECRKKLPPPTPDGREGRLFPPEQSWKTSRLVNELAAGSNKILHEPTRTIVIFAKEISILGRPLLDRDCVMKSRLRLSLRKLASRFLVLDAELERRTTSAKPGGLLVDRSSEYARSKFSAGCALHFCARSGGGCPRCNY